MDAASQLETTDAMSLKRKRSLSTESPSQQPPAAKAGRAHAQLQINYLVRHYSDDLPLVTSDESLSMIYSLLGEYNGVFERHESLAGNLGARPLGPMIIKRFERLFDGPPKVIKSHGKEAVSVTWLDVVDFSLNKPEQFTLSQTSEGVRVCQFHTKQCRVQISEEDFELITSGMPQKLIPPQPILEDEEKELGTLEMLEKNVVHICYLADQVAARARQFNYRLLRRKEAIIDRRSAETAITGAAALRASSPSNVALMNGALGQLLPQSPTSSFAALNNAGLEKLQEKSNGGGMANPAAISQATRDELLKNFNAVAERRLQNVNNIFSQDLRHPATISPRAQEAHHQQSLTSPNHALARLARASTASANYDDFRASLPPSYQNSPIPSAIANTNHFTTPSTRASAAERDDGGQFKAEMVARVEALSKGDRVDPPCDRCRRLHMDCLKNLTACVGCTKKHAKCSWKEVKEDELRATAHFVPVRFSHRTSVDMAQQQLYQHPSQSQQLQQQQTQQQHHIMIDDDHDHDHDHASLSGENDDRTNERFAQIRQHLYGHDQQPHQHPQQHRPYTNMDQLADQAYHQMTVQNLAQAAAAVDGLDAPDHDHDLGEGTLPSAAEHLGAPTAQMQMLGATYGRAAADPNVHPDLGGAPIESVQGQGQSGAGVVGAAGAGDVHRLGVGMMVG